MSQLVEKHLMCILAICCLLAYGMVYLEKAFPEPIRSDGIGYYAYLPAILIHGDPSFRTLAALRFDGEIPRWTGLVLHPETGRYVNQYGVGVSIMLLPFFVLAHLLTFLFQSPAPWHRHNYVPDGFTFFYQHAAGLGGVFYGLVGLWLVSRLLRRFFSPRVCWVTILAVFAGTNLFNYFSAESVLSHPFTFFLFALLLNQFASIYAADRFKTASAILIGGVIGLLASVRFTNVLLVPALVLWGVNTWTALRHRVVFWSRHWRQLPEMGCGIIGAFLPQMIMWRYSSGHWWYNAYMDLAGARIYWTNPKFLEVLFSLRGGVLFWSPVLVLALLGFVWLRKYCPDVFWPSVVFLLPFTYLIACWHDWAFGGGFGHRGFIEAYVFLAFPLAAFYQRVSEARQPWVKWSVAALTLVLIAYSLFFQMLYYTRELSIYGLDRQALFDILWWRKQRLESWWHLLFH